MTISDIKLLLRHVPPIFYKYVLYVVLKENRRGICSARVVPMAKICAIGSPPKYDPNPSRKGSKSKFEILVQFWCVTVAFRLGKCNLKRLSL